MFTTLTQYKRNFDVRQYYTHIQRKIMYMYQYMQLNFIKRLPVTLSTVIVNKDKEWYMYWYDESPPTWIFRKYRVLLLYIDIFL